MKYGYLETTAAGQTLLRGRDIDTANGEVIPEGWKPIEDIDEEQCGVQDGYVVIVPVPYDKGESIGYRYSVKKDKRCINEDIEAHKAALSESDYQITKCYEASLLGLELPYDVAKLHAERQQHRDKVNELEALI